MYHNGEGVPQDYSEAVRWTKNAADQGYAIAQYSLGVTYATGENVPQDYAEAARWTRKAAEQGYSDAQFYLGALQVNGNGVPEGFVLSHKWFNLAAASGHQRAAEVRDSLAETMTREQISEAQKLAREWSPK